MQRLFTPMVFILILVITASFEISRAPNGREVMKRDGFFTAMVDGKYFTVRNENRYNSELVNQSSGQEIRTPKGTQKLTRLMNHISFYGNQFFDESGNLAEERINFEYAYNENAIGKIQDGKIMLHFNNDKYYNLPEATTFVITKRQWSPDRRFFLLTAEFDCQMRRWGLPASSQEIVRLKGKMENISVTVPSWAVTGGTDRVSLED